MDWIFPFPYTTFSLSISILWCISADMCNKKVSVLIKFVGEVLSSSIEENFYPLWQQEIFHISIEPIWILKTEEIKNKLVHYKKPFFNKKGHSKVKWKVNTPFKDWSINYIIDLSSRPSIFSIYFGFLEGYRRRI